MTDRKKLIEVALPLETISQAATKEKPPRKGHPRKIHLFWWAWRPFTSCRAVLFASIVDDPSEYINDIQLQNKERERLFKIMERLVRWENTNDIGIFQAAKKEIAKSIARNRNEDLPEEQAAINEYIKVHLPAILDPFAGGGSIPAEAQRLGAKILVGDLNPLAVLINKATVEIPSKFRGMEPVSLSLSKKQPGMFQKEKRFARNLAQDVNYFGNKIIQEVFQKIGKYYPMIEITKEQMDGRRDLEEMGISVGDKLLVSAWIWSRNIDCSSPACGLKMPLLKSFNLSKRKNSKYHVVPLVKSAEEKKTLHYKVRKGLSELPGTITRGGATCVACGSPVKFSYIRKQGRNKEITTQLICIVAEHSRWGKIFLAPDEFHEELALSIQEIDNPVTRFPARALGIRVQKYGITSHKDLFSNRQTLFITSFSKSLANLKNLLVKKYSSDEAYADAIITYLVFVLGRYLDYGSKLTYWDDSGGTIRKTFGLPTMQMRWGYPETNPFGNFSGNWGKLLDDVVESIKNLPAYENYNVEIKQIDARKIGNIWDNFILCTDPPYYDNIGYAALSDYFYYWFRLMLKDVYPSLFSTLLTPKEDELIAEPGRHNSKRAAAGYFENGLFSTLKSLHGKVNREYPITFFYAYKQKEIKSESESPTGWEVFLNGLIDANYQITATWPIRTEQARGLRASGRNALASSIVLVCRPREISGKVISRREFIQKLRETLPIALDSMQQGNIAPVDLAQASIGPGMAVFSKYKKVLDPDGTEVKVRKALQLVNKVLDEYFSEQEGDIDQDSRFAVAWFEQYAFEEAPFGQADVLARAKNTSVDGMVNSGILEAEGGKVRLLRWDELDPGQVLREGMVWAATHLLIERLNTYGETGAAELLASLSPDLAADARQLAYRLYSISDRKGWSTLARNYNALVVSWNESQEQAQELRKNTPQQGQLFGEE